MEKEHQDRLIAKLRLAIDDAVHAAPSLRFSGDATDSALNLIVEATKEERAQATERGRQQGREEAYINGIIGPHFNGEIADELIQLGREIYAHPEGRKAMERSRINRALMSDHRGKEEDEDFHMSASDGIWLFSAALLFLLGVILWAGHTAIYEWVVHGWPF